MLLFVDVVAAAAAAAIFISKWSFDPTTSSAVHPVSVLILHPRECKNSAVTEDRETEKTKIIAEAIKVKANEVPTYRVREHNEHANQQESD